MINFKNLISKVSKVSKSQSLMRIIKVNFANFVNLVMSKFGEILIQKNKRVTGYGLQIAGAKKDQVKATKRQSDMSFLKGLVGEGMRGLGESYVESAFREGVKSRIGITKSCVETENGAKKDQAMHIKKEQAMQGPSRDQAVCGGDWSKRDQAMRGGDWSKRDQAVRGWSEKDQVVRGGDRSSEGMVWLGKDLTNFQRISNLSLTKGMTESRLDSVSILSRQSDLVKLDTKTYKTPVSAERSGELMSAYTTRQTTSGLVSVGMSMPSPQVEVSAVTGNKPIKVERLGATWLRYVASILCVLMLGIGQMWGDTELFYTDFTSWSTQTPSAGSTIDGVYFKAASTVTNGSGWVKTANASNTNNYIGIPFSGINGSITITVTHTNGRPTIGYQLITNSSAYAGNAAHATSMSTTRIGSNGTTTTITINDLSNNYGHLILGATGNATNNSFWITSVTITTPSRTYYYRGEDNSWNATEMTKSTQGFYSYKSSTKNDHQFKIALSTSGWDYNHSYVDAGYLGTSISTIGDYSSDNCYIWSAPASYYIIVFHPNTVMNATSSPKICASATLPAETFTISFANGGGSGSMSSLSSIIYGSNKAISTNTFTRSGYNFTGWKANVDVTIGGATKTAGTLIAAESTIQNITKDITLTAQWEEIECPSDGTLYSLTVKSVSFTNPGSTETNMVSSYATVTGGGAYIGCKDGTNGQAQVKTDGSGTVYFNANNGYVKLVLDCPIQTGDVLTFVNGSGSNQICFTTTNSRSTTYTTASNTYTFPAAFNDVSTIYVWRTSGSSTYMHSLTITRSSSCTAPTALAAASTTAKGTTFTVTDGADTNDYEFYVSTSSTAPTSGSSATYTSTSKTKAISDLQAGTTYYAWARSVCGVSNKSGWTALTGNTFTTSTVSADYHLTNVTKSSGATSGIGGSTFTAVFAAASGYLMPTPTVTIDGNTATSGTDYTWTAGTGTLTIAANKITGNIDITLNSAAAAPSSVAIGDNWLWFAGETMTLTATPTGGNGPMTYQWYKGGKTDGDAIEGATDATFSKTCAFEDAGSYYCKVTCGGTQSTWGQSGNAYDVKIPRLYVKTGHNYDPVKTDYGNVDFTRATASTATASISLGSNWDYCFNIADGCGHYYGNAGTMQYNNYGPWVTNVNNQDCGLRTTNGATYVFTINYSDWSQVTTTITFPSSNQAADKVIYFDNNDRQWSNLHYRIGRGDHTQAAALTLVPGTANLYKYTTVAYNNFAGWHIANNSGWTGSNTIYRTYTNGDAYSITYATAHEGGAVTQAAVTVTPTTSRGAGADAGVNDNCTFYNYEITTGMKTQNVSITAPSNGTITVSYTDVNNAAQSFTSGNADLAHTVIITPTVTPAMGYQLSGLTVNGNAHTPGNTYTVTGTTVVAATFSLIDYTVTLNTNGGTINAGNVTSYNYGTGATLPTNVTKDGYIFDGWFENSGLTGDAVTSISSSATGNKEFWAKWTACSGPTINSFVPSGKTDGTYPVGTALGTLTVTASAGNGGALSYLWYQYDGGNIGAAVAAAGTNNAAIYSIPNNAACVDRHYYCVVSEAGCSTTRTSDISGALTLTAASLTALECNTLYKVEDMVPASITLSGSGQYGAGLSSNTKFEVIGDPAEAGNAGGTPEMKNEAAEFAEQSFAARMYLKGASNTTGSGTTFVPTSRAVKFIVSESGTLDIYAHRVDRLYLKKVGDSGTTQLGTSTSGSGSMVSHNVTAGTYYIYATGNSTCVYGVRLNCCTTPAVPTAFSAGSITSTGTTFSITDAGDAASYDIYYATSSTAPTASTPATTTSTSKTKAVTGLTASTTYYAWVRAVCDESHKSSWVALSGSTFTTEDAEPEALVTWTMNLNTATWGAASTATTDGTNISSIATSRTGGGSGSSTYATAKVSMASAEVTDSSEPSNSAQFTFTIASGKKVEPEKVTCQVFNVSSGSRTYKAQISDSNGHVYNSTNTLAVSAEASLTDATFNFASGLALTGNVTLKIYAWGSGSDFRMGESVKLFGEVDNYTCTALNLTRGGQENGTYTVGNYTGNPLTCTVNAGEPASYQWKQYTLGQGVGDAVNAVGSGSTTTSFTPNPASANTYFYACQVTDICGNSATTPYTGTFVFNAPVHHDVDFTLTNVTYSSGDNEGTDAATEGSPFSTVFAASSGYVLPSTITVTIGGSPATVSTDYTWNSSTGALEILAASVTGDITVTIVGDLAPATKDIYYGHVKITDGALVREIPSGATQFFTNIGGTVANNTEISLSSTPSTTGMYYNSNDLTDAELSKSSNWSTSSGSNRYIRGLKFANGTTYTLALGTKVASTITFYGWCGSSSKTMTVGGEEFTSSSTKNTFAKHEFIKTGGFTGNVAITQDGDFYGILVITIQTATPCTTPTLPTATLNDQVVCEGSDITAWDATPTNASTITGKGESIAYSWKKKGKDTELATTATFDLGSSAAESQAGTYVVTVTVSKAGYASSTANKEVELTVTEGEEVTGITADKATVYPGNSVTLTATANTPATWQWYTCTNAEGAGAAIISGAASASYTIASAGAAGTYYYKAEATGTCGTASAVYTLTVTAASECENYFWFIDATDATTNGVINNRDDFFSNVTTGTSNAGTYKITIDGVDYTSTKRLGAGAYKPKFTVPESKTATLYVYGKANSSDTGKHLVIKRTSDATEMEVTDSNTDAAYSLADIPAGEWTLSCGNNNWRYAVLAVKLCGASSCTDATPTATATNAVVCSGTELSITASEYEESPTSIQWQKLNSSTSTWDNISGATSATYTVASATSANAGSYRVVVTKGCARTSNTVTIAVPSAPVFGDVPASVSVMQTLALSISTVEATDAVKYRWYKSADATWDAGDAEIGTEKNLIKAYDGETAGSTYYIFCRAQNACGITTSSAITVNVTAYVEEDCATRGNEGEAEFGFDYGSAGQGSYSSTACWTMNSNSKFLTYTAPEGKYFKTAKVTIASSSESKASYNWSTNGGSTYTAVALTVNSTLTERTIDLSAKGNVNSLQIGRNFNSTGSSGGTLYVSKICFEYTESCTATTVTVSGTGSETYTIGSGAFTEPTITLGPAAVSSETLTYSSSNEDIATVDDDGTVTFQDRAGTVTITAAYAGGEISSTQYCASEGSYTITVSCSDEAPKVVASGTNVGCNTSITLNAKMQNGTSDFGSGTYQWFRDGEEISGATSSSYIAVQAGVYTVERTGTGGCTNLSSNSATVTSETTEPEVERLVPFQYYHVDKTYTAQMKMRHLFAVKNSGKLDGKSFKLYVSRNGSDPTDVTNSNALAIWTNADGRVDTVMIDLNKLSGKYSENDELVFTCKAIDCTPAVSETYKATITMHVIGATPTLALICSGSDKEGGTRKTGELTVGGDFLTGYNKADLCEQTGNTSFDASTEWGLYTRLKANYIVTPVNGYAVFKKLNYEPFDILLLTDYPKASKSDAAATVLDDMADLVDFRPMLSLKAHMVAKTPSKWAAKGFTTAPVVPKNTRTRLNIVCYAHPMFSTIKEKTDHVQEDASDQSQIVYTMLTGAGYESGKGLQGFEIDAAENFVTIGLIHYNATAADETPSDGFVTWTPGSGDRMLVAAAERQANPEARMILFAVNCGAQSKFTETGRTVVHKCLEYLLTDHTITPMADCSFTFDNGAGNNDDDATYKSKCPECTGTKGDHKWSTAANWGPDYVLRPGKDTEVKIAASVEVDMEHALARSARIVEGGKIIIPAGKGLEVKSTIRHLDGSELSPTEISDIHVASSESGNGTLIFNNNSGDSKAQVDMYSKGFIDGEGVKNYQYIGTPFNEINALYNYYGSWIYSWGTKKNGSLGWVVVKNGGPMTAWTGYCITQESPTYYETSGTLTATGTVDISVPANENMVVGNSWTAPIDINALTTDDLEGLVANIYFFNTGVDKTGTAGAAGSRYAGGTYVTVPIHSAPYETEDDHINSLQGFFVKAPSESAGVLHLDYERHVRGTTRSSIIGDALHSPRRAQAADTDEPAVLKMKVIGENYDDKLLLLEREDFTEGFDNGWDGDKWDGNESALYIYTTDNNGTENSVSAIPELEGTIIGFRAGEDDAYTLNFEYLNSDEPLYLYDVENNTYTQIMTGMTYRFFTTDNEKHARFILTRKNPQVATGVGEVPSDQVQGTKAKKLLIGDKMFIMVNGMLYDATGKVVR